MASNSHSNLNSDVRMKGFASRISVDDVLAWLDHQLLEFRPWPLETVDLHQAYDRILGEDVVSRVDVPSFDRSMMDGYALRADETLGATAYNPQSFDVIGNSLPAHPFCGLVQCGQAVRIMTGAPIPDGADAVLPVEHTETHGQRVLALSELPQGKHVGRTGEDVRQGAKVLGAGRQLRPQDLGVLSSIGYARPIVVRRPIVRILITGNELMTAGSLPNAYRIPDANGPMLFSLVQRDGGHVAEVTHVEDTPEAISTSMTQPADVILVSGGSSVGIEDHAPRVLAQLGTLAIHGVAMRPSSPAGMGLINRTFVFLLPGNPVSCFAAYDFFAGRAIRGLGGRGLDWPYRRIRMPLARKLVSTVGRVDYARVKLTEDLAEPIAISGASILSSTTQADGFVVVPADSEGYPAKTVVDIFLYGTS